MSRGSETWEYGSKLRTARLLHAPYETPKGLHRTCGSVALSFAKTNPRSEYVLNIFSNVIFFLRNQMHSERGTVKTFVLFIKLLEFHPSRRYPLLTYPAERLSCIYTVLQWTRRNLKILYERMTIKNRANSFLLSPRPYKFFFVLNLCCLISLMWCWANKETNIRERQKAKKNNNAIDRIIKSKSELTRKIGKSNNYLKLGKFPWYSTNRTKNWSLPYFVYFI